MTDKITELRAALKEIDELADASPEKKAAIQLVNAIEQERDFLLHEIDARLAQAVKALDALEGEGAQRERLASDKAQALATKYGKSFAELRKIVEALG